MNNNTRRKALKALSLTSLALLGSSLSAKQISPKIEAKNLKSSDLAQISSYRTLGKGSAAMRVSTLGFGCMGLNYHRSVRLDEKQAIRLIHQAIERGINFFDTAESYGPFINEELVGKAIKGYEDKVFVSTKFGHKYENGKRVMSEEDSSPANIRKVCENSLRTLGVESIALFYQHRADPATPIEVVAGTIKELIKEGKVQRFGLCEVNAANIRKAHAITPLTAIQSEYHLMFRRVENEILPLCEELGIGFVPYSPINRGFLSGILNEYTEFDPSNDNRPSLPRFSPEAMRANLKIVAILEKFARDKGYTPAQIAQAWLLAKKPFIVPITGTSKLAHLEENLRSSELKLNSKEWQSLENELAKIEIVGSRYNAEQEAKVQ